MAIAAVPMHVDKWVAVQGKPLVACKLAKYFHHMN